MFAPRSPPQRADYSVRLGDHANVHSKSDQARIRTPAAAGGRTPCLAEPRDFSGDELVAAGAELGIDADTIREVHVEHERKRTRPAARPRPLGTKLRLDATGEDFTLTIPELTSRKVAAAIVGSGGIGIAGMVAMQTPNPSFMAIAGLVGVLSGYLGVRRIRSWHELRLYRDGSGLFVRFVGQRGRGTPRPGS